MPKLFKVKNFVVIEAVISVLYCFDLYLIDRVSLGNCTPACELGFMCPEVIAPCSSIYLMVARLVLVSVFWLYVIVFVGNKIINLSKKPKLK